MTVPEHEVGARRQWKHDCEMSEGTMNDMREVIVNSSMIVVM